MKGNDIKDLAAFIPLNSSYFKRAIKEAYCENGWVAALKPKDHFQSFARYDPQFAWNYAEAFVETKQPLPTFIGDEWILRAYDYQRGAFDEVVRDACVARRNDARILNSILIDYRLTWPEVLNFAKWANEEVIQAYEALFFNVRDRFKEQNYIAQIVYPEGRVVELEEDYLLKASMADLMLRGSYDHGARVGLEAGRVIKPEPMDAENAAREFEGLVFKEADKWATAGFINQDLPVFATARQLLAAKKKRPPQDEGGAPRMETISMASAIASDIARIQA